MDMNFDGKTVIITGASAGVGAACARAFASLKANLVLVARGQEGLNVIFDDKNYYNLKFLFFRLKIALVRFVSESALGA